MDRWVMLRFPLSLGRLSDEYQQKRIKKKGSGRNTVGCSRFPVLMVTPYVWTTSYSGDC